MMLFLIDYNPPQGRLVSMKTFDDSQLAAARAECLERELELLRAGIERELVILQAPSEEHIRWSHGRYFYTVEELIRNAGIELPERRESTSANVSEVLIASPSHP